MSRLDRCRIEAEYGQAVVEKEYKRIEETAEQKMNFTAKASSAFLILGATGCLISSLTKPVPVPEAEFNAFKAEIAQEAYETAQYDALHEMTLRTVGASTKEPGIVESKILPEHLATKQNPVYMYNENDEYVVYINDTDTKSKNYKELVQGFEALPDYVVESFYDAGGYICLTDTDAFSSNYKALTDEKDPSSSRAYFLYNDFGDVGYISVNMDLKSTRPLYFDIAHEFSHFVDSEAANISGTAEFTEIFEKESQYIYYGSKAGHSLGSGVDKDSPLWDMTSIDKDFGSLMFDIGFGREGWEYISDNPGEYFADAGAVWMLSQTDEFKDNDIIQYSVEHCPETMAFMEKVFKDMESGNLNRGTVDERLHNEFDHRADVAAIVAERHTYEADYREAQPKPNNSFSWDADIGH